MNSPSAYAVVLHDSCCRTASFGPMGEVKIMLHASTVSACAGTCCRTMSASWHAYSRQDPGHIPCTSCFLLVQVLSPSLVGRAHVWGNKLAVRGTWTCVDAPYFEAPGTVSG